MATKIVMRQRSALKLRFQPGSTGPAGDVAVGTTTTGAPGSSAAVANSGTPQHAVLNFTIPRGDVGPANSLEIGAVTTLPFGEDATAQITGEAPNQTLNLGLPMGEQGPPGLSTIGDLPAASVSVKLFAQESVVIDCFGDSIMYGASSSTGLPQAAVPPPLMLQTLLRTYFGGTATVNNRAISGSNTSSMLGGYDGSGQTFEARVAASSAEVVYCNHGVNDCQNDPPTPPQQFHENLIEIVRIVRAYGKCAVLCTPTPLLPVYALGSDSKTERIKDYAEIVREVCRETSTTLVDQNAWVNKMMMADSARRQTDFIPDAIHPSDDVYLAMGRNMAIPFVHPHRGFSRPDEIVGAGASTILLQPANTPTIAPWSRAGIQRITSGSGPQAVRAAVLVEEPGLDINAAHLIWGGGTANANVTIDTIPIGTVSMSGSFAPSLVQDHEVRVISNAMPGLHLVEFGQASGLSIGFNYIRSRAADTTFKQRLGAASGSPYCTINNPILQNIEVGPGSNVVVLCDEIPTSRVADVVNIEFVASLAKGQGIVLHGCWSAGLDPLVNDGRAVPGVIVYIEAAGGWLVAVNPGGGGTTVLVSTDLSSASHKYRIVVDTAGTLTAYVDGAVSATHTVPDNLKGGVFGLFNDHGTQPLRVDRVSVPK